MSCRRFHSFFGYYGKDLSTFRAESRYPRPIARNRGNSEESRSGPLRNEREGRARREVARREMGEWGKGGGGEGGLWERMGGNL